MLKSPLLTALIALAIPSAFSSDATLMDFENPSEALKHSKRAVELDTKQGKALKISSNSNWSTQGKRSLKVEFAPFKKGLRQWPGLSCRTRWNDFRIKDWSKYGEFAFDVNNPTPYRIRLCVEIRDNPSKNGNTTVIFLEPQNSTTVKINLDKVGEKTARPVNLKNIQQFIIYCTRPPQPWEIWIDNIRLLNNKKQLGCKKAYQHAKMLNTFLTDKKSRKEYSKQLKELHRQIFSKNSIMPAEKISKEAQKISSAIDKKLYRPEFMWNFGPANNGMAGSWKNAGRNAYTPQNKFGWLNTGGLKAESKHFSSEWRDPGNYFNTSRPPVMYLNPEQEGLVSSYAPATFRADLPNGKYRVMTIAGYPGGLHMCPVNMTVKINEKAHKITLAQRYIYEIPVWKTEVTNGKLELEFSSNNSRQWLINAIAVWPDNDQTAARREFVDRYKDHLYILPENLRAEWSDSRCIASQRNTIPAKNSQGFVIYPTNTITDYKYNFTPSQTGLPNGLTLTAAENEMPTSMFGVLALGNSGENLRAAATNLTGPAIINSKNIKIKIIENTPWPLRRGSNKYITRLPRILREQGEYGFDWEKWQARQLYVMIEPPANGFKSGTYTGKITLNSNGTPVSVPIKLIINPIKLQTNPEMSYGAYWYWYTEKKSPRVDSELKSMRLHGLNMLAPWRLSVKPEKKNGKIVIKFPSQPPPILLLAGKYGFYRPAPWQMEGYLRDLSKLIYAKYMFRKQGVGGENLPDSFFAHMSDAVRQVLSWQKKHNLGEIYFYPVDEVYNPVFARKLLEACKKVPGAKVFSNSNPLIQEDLRSLIDVSCYPYTNYMNEEGLKKYIAKNNKSLSWTYSCPGSYGGGKAETRLCWGLSGRKIGLKGFWPWAYCSTQGNPFSAFDGPWIDPQLVYPGLEPISTMQYEAIRQGIDDARYLYTLRSLIQKASKSSNPAKCLQAQYARQRLNKLMNEVPVLFRTGKAGSWAENNLDSTRNELTKLILLLQK